MDISIQFLHNYICAPFYPDQKNLNLLNFTVNPRSAISYIYIHGLIFLSPPSHHVGRYLQPSVAGSHHSGHGKVSGETTKRAE